MRKQKQMSGWRRPPGVILCGLLMIALSLWGHLSPDPRPDLPAADEPAGLTLPAEETLLPFSSESAPLPAGLPPVELPAPAPVMKESGYQNTGTVYVKNTTSYDLDIPTLLKKDCPVKLGSQGVQVLIMHTHGTESYTPSPGHEYTASGDYRTTDSSCNMLRVGQVITDRLNERGISTVHSTTLNDYPAYSGSYNRALKDIQSYIEQYPTIQVVIDVHRDAIVSGDTYYKTSAQVDGRETAQLMMVTGTDEGGLSHDGWRNNLTFQAQLHNRLNSEYPGIMRPMSIRTSRFNQHIRAGSMLVEVGACGNTLEEAIAAAELFADTLADTLLDEQE